ncbi:hypothetical protein ACP4OV_027331 [Aristida adscensionis]
MPSAAVVEVDEEEEMEGRQKRSRGAEGFAVLGDEQAEDKRCTE